MPDGAQETSWKIVGTGGEDVFLVYTGGVLGQASSRGRILDVRRGILFPESPLLSIIARGYWDEYAGPQGVLSDLLAKVKQVDNDRELTGLVT